MFPTERISMDSKSPDLLETFKRRVSQEYSLNPDKNAEVVACDPPLQQVWHWIARSRQHHRKVVGLMELLTSKEASSMRSNTGTHRLYEAEFRNKSLMLLNEIDLESQGSMKAFVAISNLDIPLALRILRECHCEPLLSFLETFQFDDLQPKVKQLLKRFAEQAEDVFIKVCLLFMSGPENNRAIINYLPMPHKLIFALKYLSDNELLTLYEDQLKYAQNYSNILALVIAGCTQRAIPVLQTYQNETGDIQTVGLLSIIIKSQYPSPDLFEWVNSYKDTLNKLELWHNRCKLNIEENEICKTQREKGKHFRCYYCGNSLELNERTSSLVNQRRGNHHHPKAHINHCTDCLNPFPRCVICLLPYNSINPYFEIARLFRNVQSPPPRTKLDEWFSWCEKCHHGGHNAHLLEWFEQTNECAAAGCNCNCMLLDEPGL